MEVFEDIHGLRTFIKRIKENKKDIGLVPTMGSLHEGHVALIRKCKSLSNISVVSIFVNPTQFGPKEDFNQYPRDLGGDLKICAMEGVDVVFCPSKEGMYHNNFRTIVKVEGLSEVLCGTFRPGHFDGMVTVVLKLFLIVSPDRSFFGEKDYQQLVIIKQMVKDLNIPVSIHSVETQREEDGLAFSTRNRYLSYTERTLALSIYSALLEGKRMFIAGNVSPVMIYRVARDKLVSSGLKNIDYISLVEPNTLITPNKAYTMCRLLIAAKIGSNRLIDNIAI